MPYNIITHVIKYVYYKFRVSFYSFKFHGNHSHVIVNLYSKLSLNYLLVHLLILRLFTLCLSGHLTLGDLFTSGVMFTFIIMLDKLFEKVLKCV